MPGGEVPEKKRGSWDPGVPAEKVLNEEVPGEKEPGEKEPPNDDVGPLTKVELPNVVEGCLGGDLIDILGTSLTIASTIAQSGAFLHMSLTFA